MTKTARITGMWALIRRMNPRAIALIRQGKGPARVTLLLTTIGRKTGLKRVTPLQYEEVDGRYYVAAGRGPQSDWFRNLEANPRVEVDVHGRSFPALAEAVTDPVRIADFLALRLKRHPLMIGLLTRLEGLPLRYTRADLERFAAGKALAILQPLEAVEAFAPEAQAGPA